MRKRPPTPPVRFGTHLRIALTATALITTAVFNVGEQRVLAAKKYYPPGFTASEPNASPEPTAPLPVLPSLEKPEVSRQVIIKRVSVPAKPTDPLIELLDAHRFLEAQRLVDKRIAKAPTNHSLRLIRARILRERQQLQTSEAEYRWVLAKSKSRLIRAQAYSGLGFTQLVHADRARLPHRNEAAMGLEENARDSFQQSLKLQPNLLEAWHGLAELAFMQHRLSDAEKAVTKARALAPQDSGTLLLQGRLLLEHGKLSEALPPLFKARQHVPCDPEVFRYLGQAYLGMERYDDAIIQFQQVLEQKPGHAEALKLLSMAYQGKMKPQDAQLTLQKAVTLNPGDTEAVQALLKTYQQQNTPDAAILLLTSLVKEQPQQPLYPQLLLEHLLAAKRWGEAFEQGASAITPLLNHPESLQASSPLLAKFSEAAFAKTKGSIDRQVVLNHPATQAVIGIYTRQLDATPFDLEPRLRLLMLDPTIAVPFLPEMLIPPVQSLPTAIKIAYLQGDWKHHGAWLSQWREQSGASPEAMSRLAQESLFLGDYGTAQTLAALALKATPNLEEAKATAHQAAEAQKKAESQIRSLQMLPGKIPPTYWKASAEDALRLSTANGKLHGLVADTLIDRKEYRLAWIHQQLAAQYALTPSEKQRWLKRAEKTRRKLDKQPAPGKSLQNHP